MKADGLNLHWQHHHTTSIVQLIYSITQGALARLFARVAIVQLVAVVFARAVLKLVHRAEFVCSLLKGTLPQAMQRVSDNVDWVIQARWYCAWLCS
jgi:hypothetical protein